MEWMDALTKVVCSVGFPIAVTGFLLWERLTTTKELTKTVAANTEVINLLMEHLKHEK